MGGGGVGGALSMRMQVILDSRFAGQSSAPCYKEREEKRVQGLD